jgi:hypothetical protein
LHAKTKRKITIEIKISKMGKQLRIDIINMSFSGEPEMADSEPFSTNLFIELPIMP